jgi:TonB family protein
MIRGAFLAALALLSTQAQGQTPPSRRAPVWQMDWGDHHCALVRLPDASTPFPVAIRSIPGSFVTGLRTIRVAGASPPRRVSAVVLMPSGESFPVSSGPDMVGNNQRITNIWGLPERFWEVFEGSSELQLREGSAIRRQIPLTQAREATAAFRRCVSAAVREWGVDEATWRSLSRPPTTINGFGLAEADYPMAALRAGAQGRMVLRVTVSPEGRATECAVVETSGHRAIDAAVCPAVLRRARFTAPLDAEGRATSARIATSVTWLIR